MFVITVSLLIVNQSVGSFRIYSNPIDRGLFMNITATGFNNNNSFQVKIDNQQHTLLNANLYRGHPGCDSDQINLVSDTQVLFPIDILFIRYPLSCTHGGTFGMGAGSTFIRDYGPIDLVTRENTVDRILTIGSNDSTRFSTSCVAGSLFSVPFSQYSDRWLSVVVNVEFSLRYAHIQDSSTSDSMRFDGPVSLIGRVGYMSIPRGIGIEIGLLLTRLGAIPVAQGRNRFEQCMFDHLGRLPDILISFIGDSGEMLGELVQTPTDYTIWNSDEFSCQLRFDVLMGDGPYAMDPMALSGVNVRLDDTHITFCDPTSGA